VRDVVTRGTRFATPTEDVVASALDRARIVWQYEPTTFVIERDEAGLEREACAPDFYLPSLDLYLEVSAGSPRRLNRKRAKLRRLAEVHPGVRVELLGPLEIAELERNPARYLRQLAGTLAA
jgi:bifunctional protein TilS/HprT